MINYLSKREIKNKYSKKSNIKLHTLKTEFKDMYLDFDDSLMKIKQEQINKLSKRIIDKVNKNYKTSIKKNIKMDIKLSNTFSSNLNSAYEYKQKNNYLESLKIYESILDYSSLTKELCICLFKNLICLGKTLDSLICLDKAIEIDKLNNNAEILKIDEEYKNNILLLNEENYKEYINGLSKNNNYLYEYPYRYLKDQIEKYKGN